MEHIVPSIDSFVGRTKADLLIYYARNHENHIDEYDVEAICNLVSLHSTPTKKLNVMLHTLGGNINAAIGLVEFLKERYPERIESIIFKVAKSSGSFIAISAEECYMHSGSALSDFTLEENINNSAHNEAARKTLAIAFSGVAKRFSGPFWAEYFLYPKKHGTPIPKAILHANEYVERLRDYPVRIKPLAFVHNELIDVFHNDQKLRKVYGFNTFLYQDRD